MPGSCHICPIPECPKHFASKYNLQRHIEVVHLGHHRHPCPICQKKLTSKQNLLQHIHIHIGDKPFVCPHPGCGRSFRQASLLSSHKKLHKGRRVEHVECGIKVRASQLTDLVYFSLDQGINPNLPFRID